MFDEPPAGLRGAWRTRQPLASYTTWRVGGPAERWYQPADSVELGRFMAQLPASEPLFWLGLGSNILVRDGGIPGIVITTHGALQQLFLTDAVTVSAEAGVPCAHIARFCARHDLTGAEFLAGIPGTLGGALAMNAGAWGGTTWDLVRTVTTLDRRGQTHQRSAPDYTIGYRHVQPRHGADEGFLAARLQLTPGDGAHSLRVVRQLLDQRNRTQPTGTANCGSVFRNPPGAFAARLIEAAGLKGSRSGDAYVSPKHANFIINAGRATAADIEALIAHIVTTVKQHAGIELIPEVRIVGIPAKETLLCY